MITLESANERLENAIGVPCYTTQTVATWFIVLRQALTNRILFKLGNKITIQSSRQRAATG